MQFSVLTLFPDMVSEIMNTSILGRAVENGIIDFRAVNIRDFAYNKHKSVDDYPYGGGAGMLMQAEPVYQAYESVRKELPNKPRVIYTTPQGRPFNQEIAKELSKESSIIILCGHYEGIDERVLDEIVTDYISIGDYVLTGGELPAMIMVDAIARLIPGVLNNDVSAEFETFEDNLLEYPQYSRPNVWHNVSVPEVLLSGDHAKVDAWRWDQSIRRTLKMRPDLFERFLTEDKGND